MTNSPHTEISIGTSTQRFFCSGQSVFLADRPGVFVGEVYDLDECWFAWVRPPEVEYMSARARSRAEVLAQLAERSGIALRARQP